MTEKQKDRRSLVLTVAVLLTVSVLFSVLYFAVLPLCETLIIQNSCVGLYIYYNPPKSEEEYNDIISTRSKESLSDINPNFDQTDYPEFLDFEDNGSESYRMWMFGYFRPEYVMRFTDDRDCFIGKYKGSSGSRNNYIVMLCRPYGEDFDPDTITLCMRPENAPTIHEFKNAIGFSAHRLYVINDFMEKYGGSIDWSFRSMHTAPRILILKDGVVLLRLNDDVLSAVEYVRYEDADSEFGLPLTKLIDLFNEDEAERSGKK